MNPIPTAAALAALLLLAACGQQSEVPAPAADAPAADATAANPDQPDASGATGATADADTVAGSGFEAAAGEASADGALPSGVLFARLTELCGQSFAGRVLVDEPAGPGNDAFAGKPLVMHVRDCSPDTLRIPFHVGDDHSRTWVLTRTATGLRLKHDHRHEDGTPDAVTLYGGASAQGGSTGRVEFPVDAESVAMFREEGLEVSVTNVWALELRPGQEFVYELARPGGRLFRVGFDLSQPVETPPAAWGFESP